MTEYKDNEAYEKFKNKWLSRLENNMNEEMVLDAGDVCELFVWLQESKWAGAKSVRPLPVIRDGEGKLIEDYDLKDWFRKLNEELDRLKEIAYQADVLQNYQDKNDGTEKWYIPLIARELQDVKHVCNTMQYWLGYNDKDIDQLCVEMNEKNRSRGYFEKK